MNIKLTPEIIEAIDKLSETNDLSINNIHYAKAVKKEWIKIKENLQELKMFCIFAE